MFTTTCTIEVQKWAVLPPAKPEERSVVLARPERALAGLEQVPREVASVFQAMLDRSRMAIENLQEAQQEMAKLPSFMDREIEWIQQESAVQIADVFQRTKDTEEKRQSQIDSMKKIHTESMTDRAKEMSEEEQRAQEKIAQVRAAIQAKGSANQLALIQLQEQIEDLGPDNQQMKIKYDESLKSLEQDRQHEIASARARLNQLNSDRQTQLAEMDRQAQAGMAKVSSQLSQSQAYVEALQRDLERLRAWGNRLTNLVQEFDRDISSKEGRLNNLNGELAHQQSRRRGTRILGFKF